MFSIIIPTWNNIDCLKLCVESIRKNSTHNHQIVVHINDGSDGSLQWVKEQNIEYIHTPKNEGVCIALNMAAAKATTDYICYINDDMYCLPSWDAYLVDEIKKFDDDCFMISSTMIEPVNTNNNAVIVGNYGNHPSNFLETKLLSEFENLEKENWLGSCWPPNVVHKKYWNLVGGYSIEFSPGMSSDDDFAMKMYQIGCRNFIGIGKSKVYHFQQKSTGRIVKNNGPRQFLLKWNLLQSYFNKRIIKKGFSALNNSVANEISLTTKDKLKLLYKKNFKR